MLKGNDYKVSARKREFTEYLAKINCKRGIGLAIVLSILIPIMVTVGRFTGIGMLGVPILVVTMIIEMIQLIALPLLIYVVKKNEIDIMPATYKVYYVVTFASLFTLACFEMHVSGSLSILAGALAVYMFIPVISRREQKISFAVLILSAIPMCMIIADLGSRFIVDVALMIIGAAGFGRYVHEKSRHYEKVRDELREKTVSSEHDPLTGLTNRRGLARKASILWPYCSRTHATVGIIAIDVDFFKKYNDKFGHPEGDKCLKKIAHAIKDSARRGTDITARTGGEEFLVFVQDMTYEEMVALALKIRSRVAELQIPHAYAGVSKYVTVSMGIGYTYPSVDNNFQKLYEEADKALYMAKENGRNCIVCGNLVYGRMKNAFGTAINE